MSAGAGVLPASRGDRHKPPGLQEAVLIQHDRLYLTRSRGGGGGGGGGGRKLMDLINCGLFRSNIDKVNQ